MFTCLLLHPNSLFEVFNMTAVALLESGIGDVNQGGFLMPTGSILNFAGTVIPTGWLSCDGSAVSRSAYATLFAAVSTTFGAGDGSTTFNIPDLRGRFTRFNDNMLGAAGAAGRDTGRAHGSAQTQTTAKNGLSNAASAVSGSVSGTVSNTDLTHSHTNNAQLRGTASGGSFSSFGDNVGSLNTPATQNALGNHNHTFSASLASGSAAGQSMTGDAETRPINLSVYAIIKI
jgi:microcystin-dependent protein